MTGELPGRGETTPPPRERFDPREADDSGTTLNLTEASRTFDVSVATLRRRLDAGEISGAHKRPGPSGEEWRLPVAALDVLFDRRDTGEPEEPSRSTAAADPRTDALVDALRSLTERLDRTQAELTAGEEARRQALEEREAARVEAVRADAAVEAARERAERLEAELERARERAEEERRRAEEERARRERVEGALSKRQRRRLEGPGT